MTSLIVTQSNRLERLADAACAWLRAPLSHPLESDVVIVQSRGMATWLARVLANDRGICANVSFPFPKSALTELVDIVLGPDQNFFQCFAKETTTWRLLELLHDREKLSTYTEVANYVDGNADRRLSLAVRIADMFEQYLVYRMDMLRDWEQKKQDPAHWQADLWLALVAEFHTSPWLITTQLIDKIPRCPSLPERMAVFGPATLPPLYLQILQSLASVRPVHLFVHAPSPFYWGDVRTRSSQIRAAVESGLDELETESVLLSSFGKIGRDFQVMLEAFPYIDVPGDFFEKPEEKNLLNVLQADIFYARGRDECAAYEWQVDDDSLEFHACHSPMREVEILRDQLLDLFENSDLRPDQVVVMMPDIDAYAPLIEAIFAIDPLDPLFIPFTVSDRAHREAFSTIEAFLAVLDVFDSRFSAAQVVDILAYPSIQSAFDLNSDEVDRITEWVTQVKIRWAADKDHRQQEGQPGSDLNTWNYGLERLFLGYAFPSQGSRFFGGRLGYDHVEGQDIMVLGKLSRFVRNLTELRCIASRPQTMPAWITWLNAVLDKLFSSSKQNAYEVHVLRQAVSELTRASESLTIEMPLSLAAIRGQMVARLEAVPMRARFLNGGVSFCALLPMRAIPFPAIFLLGLSETAFPRSMIRDPLDLMANKPKLGDRSRRNDDMFLFLETLLSARQKLVISYVGQSQKDNRERPPSVAVSSLWDAICARVRFPQGAPPNHATLKEYLVKRHPLQPFSVRYFSEPSPFFSYSDVHLAGAKKLLAPRLGARPFITQPIPAEIPNELDLKQLVKFFKDPVRTWLRQRLGVEDERRVDELAHGERTQITHLEREYLGRFVIRKSLFQVPVGYDELLALGLLPQGGLGRAEYESVLQNVEPMLAELGTLWSQPRPDAKLIEVPLAHCVLTGAIHDWRGTNLIRFNFGKKAARHLMATWIQLLAVSVAESENWSANHVFKGEKYKQAANIHIAAPSNSAKVLSDLVQLYQEGLAQPLPLPADAALEMINKSGSVDLRQVWLNATNRVGQAWWQRVFEVNDALLDKFRDTAERVYAPLQDQLS